MDIRTIVGKLDNATDSVINGGGPAGTLDVLGYSSSEERTDALEPVIRQGMEAGILPPTSSPLALIVGEALLFGLLTGLRAAHLALLEEDEQRIFGSDNADS